MLGKRVGVTSVAILTLVLVASIWLVQRESQPKDSGISARPADAHETQAPVVALADPATTEHPAAAAVVSDATGQRPTDYYQLVNSLMPEARAGSAAAQYEIARVMRYCEQEWHNIVYSSATGAARTPEELRSLRTKLDARSKKRIDEANQRCASFANTDLATESARWLQQAVTAAYAPAVFMDAQLSLTSSIIKNDQAGSDKARHQAVQASLSKDPEILFGMANFVAPKANEGASSDIKMSAWLLLACETGFNCNAGSDFIKSRCVNDPQCANDETVIEYIQRITGAKFVDVQQRAGEIRAAIDAGDTDALAKFL
jgi:hypothetical protein